MFPSVSHKYLHFLLTVHGTSPSSFASIWTIFFWICVEFLFKLFLWVDSRKQSWIGLHGTDATLISMRLICTSKKIEILPKFPKLFLNLASAMFLLYKYIFLKFLSLCRKVCVCVNSYSLNCVFMSLLMRIWQRRVNEFARLAFIKVYPGWTIWHPQVVCKFERGSRVYTV